MAATSWGESTASANGRPPKHGGWSNGSSDREGAELAREVAELTATGRRRLALAAGMLLPALVVLALLAWGFTREPRYLESPIIGRPAPSFALTLFDGPRGRRAYGRTVRLADLRGRVVVINFWASWCTPCREEAPVLEAAWRRLAAREVAELPAAGGVFLGVNVEREEAPARAFVEEFGLSYPNGRDAGGRIAIDYGVWGLPELFIVDPAGRITYKHVGTIGAVQLAAKIDEARRGVVSSGQGRGDYRSTR